MGKTLAFIHTSSVLVPVFAGLAKKAMPDAEFFHMVDESLIKNTIASGRLTATTTRRLVNMIQSAREGGADVVLVTCSSIGPATSAARELFDFPVLRVDESLAEEAIRAGGRIGVAATLRTTLEPTVTLLQKTAAARGRDVEITSCLCDGAFEAVVSGDTETHDRLVSAKLQELMKTVDVVVLAQASMARVADKLPGELRTKPILASPELAVRRAKEALLAV